MSDNGDSLKADLRTAIKQRDALIQYIEALIKRAEAFGVDVSDVEGADAPPVSDSGNGGTEKPATKNYPKALDHTAFLGMKMPESIEALLKIVQTDMTPQDIRDALLKGGYKSSTGDPAKLYASVFTTLRRLAEKDVIWRRDDGKWGLAKWYPNRKKPPATNNAEKESPKATEKPAKDATAS